MRDFVSRTLPFLLLMLLPYGAPASFASDQASSGAPETPHMTLRITPVVTPVDSIVTLRITYYGVGLYATSVVVTPNDALSFDPPRSMPCIYNQDATNCTQLTFRTRTPGMVTIHASAYGEIYDPTCTCWRFTGVSDDGSVVVTITGNQCLLPLVQR